MATRPRPISLPAAGTYVFELTVSDGDKSDTDSVRVTINDESNQDYRIGEWCLSQDGHRHNHQAVGDGQRPDGDPVTNTVIKTKPNGSESQIGGERPYRPFRPSWRLRL